MATATERRARTREKRTARQAAQEAARAEAEALRVAEAAAASTVHHPRRGRNDLGPVVQHAQERLEVQDNRVEVRGGQRRSLGAAARVVGQRPVDTLLRRGLIQRWQFHAAERLLGDYRAAGGHRSPASSLASMGGRVDGSKGRGGPLVGIDAWNRLTAALAASGRVGANYLQSVVLGELPAAQVAEALDHDRRYGIERLREALTDAAVFYGLPVPASVARTQEGPGRIGQPGPSSGANPEATPHGRMTRS